MISDHFLLYLNHEEFPFLKIGCGNVYTCHIIIIFEGMIVTCSGDGERFTVHPSTSPVDCSYLYGVRH